MLSLITKRIHLEPNKTSTGELATPLDKLLLLAATHHLKANGELFIEWNEHYIHLEIAPLIYKAAYTKFDEFQFGKLLAQMAAVSQDEIDKAFQSVKVQEENKPKVRSMTDVTQVPPSQRIGSILVAHHVISPHMVGTVLRAQVLERVLRLLSLDVCKYTYESKESVSTPPGQGYPYLDPTVGTDEVLFHALIWRSSMRVVHDLLEYVRPFQPVLRLGSGFAFSEALANVCRMEFTDMESNWVSLLRGESMTLEKFLSLKTDQKAMNYRLAAAFLLTFADRWSVSEPKRETPKVQETSEDEPTQVTKVPEEAKGLRETPQKKKTS